MPRLLSGSAHFHVVEIPAYAPAGVGDHLWVEIEKEGLNTDAVAEALAQAMERPRMDVGYAGRKDRHAITRQTFTVLHGDAERLDALGAALGRGGRCEVVQVSRHTNKLRRGHLRGNRFSLALEFDSEAEVEALSNSARELAASGLRNRFGPQRFGFAGASLSIARAWAKGDFDRAVEYVIDASGEWTLKDPLPDGFRRGADGRVLGALRRDTADTRRALMAGGPAWLKMIASAGQSAIFNAVLDARERAGLLRTFRVGDIGRTAGGGPFRCTADRLDDTNERAASGAVSPTGPMPGTARLRPDPPIDAEEREWSAPVGIDWACFDTGGALQSPGERRPLVIPFEEPPLLETRDGVTWLSFALPPGAYATEVLAEFGVAMPEDRRGSG